MHTLDDFSVRVSPPPSRSGDTKLSETPDSTEAIFLLMSNNEYGFGECGVTIFLLRFAGLLFGVILQCRVVVRWKVTPSQYEIWLRGRIFNCVMPDILCRKLHNSEEHSYPPASDLSAACIFYGRNIHPSHSNKFGYYDPWHTSTGCLIEPLQIPFMGGSQQIF